MACFLNFAQDSKMDKLFLNLALEMISTIPVYPLEFRKKDMVWEKIETKAA